MPDYPIVPIPEPTRSEPLQGEVLFGPSPTQQSAQPMLALLDLVSFIMDRMIEVPGTKVRIGLNTFLLVLPIVGDAFSSAISAAILTIGLSVFRVPRIIAARMMMNSLIDASIGWIPVLGDVFNLWFKADTRNVRLLIEYAGRPDQEPPSTWKHWLIVVGMVLLFLLIMTLIGMGVWSLIFFAVRSLQTPPAP